MIHLFIPLAAVLVIFGVLGLFDALRLQLKRLRRPRPDAWAGQATYYRNRGRR